MDDVIYCDAAATTMMSPNCIETMTNWCNRGNPSSAYASANEAKKMIANFRRYIAKICDFDLQDYKVIFTSGATESNCMIILSAIRSYTAFTGYVPHIIISAVEHNSIIKFCDSLKNERILEYTAVPIRKIKNGYGTVNPIDIQYAIKPNTCLISIMSANNETGIINNIVGIGQLAHDSNVPFHTDAVQIFGKSPIMPDAMNIDAFSVSFHKIHGPPGVGMLVIKSRFINGYNIQAHIAGTQNEGLRGGTENLPGLAASFAALKETMSRRNEKNTKQRFLRTMFLNGVADKIQCVNIINYNNKLVTPTDEPIIVFIMPIIDEQPVIPSIILLSVFRKRFCNKAARRSLEENGIIVSVGSACNTSHNEPSHVIKALEIPDELSRCILRISFSDNLGRNDMKRLIKKFVEVIMSDTCLF